MDSFIFSLNATVPVFLIIVFGFVLMRFGMFTEDFIRVCDRFNFKVTLPILLFVDIATADIRESFDWRFSVFCIVATTVMFFGAWIGAALLMKDKWSVGAFAMSSFRGSTAVLGVAFCTNIYGDAGFAPLMIVSVVPLYNIYSVLAMTISGKYGEAGAEQKQTKGQLVKSVLWGIITNPLIFAIVVAIPFAMWKITIPTIPMKFLNSIKAIATPLALLVLGAGFQPAEAKNKLKPTVIATFLKLVVGPGIFLPLAVWFGFRGAPLVAIMVMLTSPTTVACYIMAKSMKNDAVLTSGVVALSTLLSSVTITLSVFVLRSCGFI